MRAQVVAATPEAIAEAAELLRRGRLVAFPTETVYGLGADALNEEAVKGIFQAKGRPADDPLIVHVADALHVAAVALPRPRLDELAARFWPGPLTLVLPRLEAVPLAVTAGRETVAVRVPAHPVAQRLIQETGVPIAAPSANLFARPSPTVAAHVLHDLGDRIDLILDGGPTDVGLESTVLDLTGDLPTVLRPGGVTVEQLREVLGEVSEPRAVRNDPRSPGTAERHYSPRARVDLFDDGSEERLEGHVRTLEQRGERVARLALPDDPAEAAQRLFAVLRELDATSPDVIVARMPPPGGLGTALRDRLRRAANGRVIESS
jgi:L-threonylcarbamoyladenylate synthase